MKGLEEPHQSHASVHNFLSHILATALIFSACLFLSACNTGSRQEGSSESATQDTDTGNNQRTAKATMEPASGSQVSGEAKFTQEAENRVRFQLSVSNLPPGGEHAVHLHEKGDCSAEDASSAGGHWNPTMKPHGRRGQGAYHKGDVGNMTADSNGKAELDLVIEGWTIGGADSTNILEKAVIIHAKPDDFTSQPSGNAGDRISCGVIKEG